MGANSNIEWTDATWNPIGGCSIASPGCTNCYAQGLAGTRLKDHPLYRGTTSPSKAGPVFNGTLTAAPDDHPVWTWPLRWRGAKTPRRGPDARSMIFVGDMSDLFHADRPDAVIDRIFAVMALSPQHTFQVLTKRAERMRNYLTANTGAWDTGHACGRVAEIVERMRTDNRPVGPLPHREPGERWWPLPNVWLGVSAERQKEADERIPHLLATPAAVRFVSAEPLLGATDLRRWMNDWGCDACGYGGDRTDDHCPNCGWTGDGGPGESPQCPKCGVPLEDYYACPECGASNDSGFGVTLTGNRRGLIDWVIAGGESGPNARPMHPDWARSIRDQCQAAGVAFFFKQWGEWVPGENASGPPPTRTEQTADWFDDHWYFGRMTPKQSEELHRDDEPDVYRVGKHRAGRLLDGREWSEFPEHEAA